MKELQADHWSRIGRFRRAKWPNVGRQGTNLKFLNGCLLCDLASDGAKVCQTLQSRNHKLISCLPTGHDSVNDMVAHGDVQDSSQE
jgi:hypothetical protein